MIYSDKDIKNMLKNYYKLLKDFVVNKQQINKLLRAVFGLWIDERTGDKNKKNIGLELYQEFVEFAGPIYFEYANGSIKGLNGKKDIVYSLDNFQTIDGVYYGTERRIESSSLTGDKVAVVFNTIKSKGKKENKSVSIQLYDHSSNFPKLTIGEDEEECYILFERNYEEKDYANGNYAARKIYFKKHANPIMGLAGYQEYCYETKEFLTISLMAGHTYEKEEIYYLESSLKNNQQSTPYISDDNIEEFDVSISQMLNIERVKETLIEALKRANGNIPKFDEVRLLSEFGSFNTLIDYYEKHSEIKEEHPNYLGLPVCDFYQNPEYKKNSDF